MFLTLAPCLAAPAAAQNIAYLQSQNFADRQSLPPANPNAPPISAQSRYRYQSGHWWYRNPTPYSTSGRGNEWAEREPLGSGEWYSNRPRPPVFSRYSIGYRPQWSPYQGYRYGYDAGSFGNSYYGYGNGYYGLQNGYYGYGGNGYFSNGAYGTGN
jgi:hypothetical protein